MNIRHTEKGNTYSGHRYILTVFLCLFVLGLAALGYSPRVPIGKVNAGPVKKTTADRVYLNNADRLHYDNSGPHPDAQILNGNVSFTHRNTTLTCDSAYFFEASNSFEAFGRVRLRQGDTLSLTSDWAFYDGNAEMAYARSKGKSPVVLNRRGSTLTTDSLLYSASSGEVWYETRGTLRDKGRTLSSDWGKYRMHADEAEFSGNVILSENGRTLTCDRGFMYNKTGISEFYDNVVLKDGTNTLTSGWCKFYQHQDRAEFQDQVVLTNRRFRMETEHLNYNTRTNIAYIDQEAIIFSDDGEVVTSNGTYNTKTDEMRLFDRSTVRNSERTITGDSLFYNKKSGIAEGFGNVIYRDIKNSNDFAGNYVWYDEQKGSGIATRNAVVKDYSQRDTVYMHGDSIRMYTYNKGLKDQWRLVNCYDKVSIYRRDVQAICDYLTASSRDSTVTLYQDPCAWSGNRQLLGDTIRLFMRQEKIDRAQVLGNAISIERVDEADHYNQVQSKVLYAWFTDGELSKGESVGNVESVYYYQDEQDSTLIGFNYVETDTMRMWIDHRQLQKIWMSRNQGCFYPINQIPADKMKLRRFAWYGELRPRHGMDVLNWRRKK